MGTVLLLFIFLPLCALANYSSFCQWYNYAFQHSLSFLEYLFFLFFFFSFFDEYMDFEGFFYLFILIQGLVIAPRLISSLKSLSFQVLALWFHVWPVSMQNTVFTSKGIRDSLFLKPKTVINQSILKKYIGGKLRTVGRRFSIMDLRCYLTTLLALPLVENRTLLIHPKVLFYICLSRC